MKYLSKSTWNKLPIPENDYRPRFFIELYQEILNVDTPSSYQARTMNIFSLADEVLNLIKYYQNSGKNKFYIQRSLKEFIQVIQNDEIAKSIFREEVDIILTKFQTKDELEDSQINELSLIIKIFLDLDRKNSYWLKMKNELLDSICNKDVDLTKIKTNLDRINKTTRLFVSYLLNNSFPNTFLFNRTDMFTQKTNYKNRTFEEQLEKIINELNSSSRTFEVYFLISSSIKIEQYFSSPTIQNYPIFLHSFQKFQKNSEFKKFHEQVQKYHGEMKHFYTVSFDIKSPNYANALLKAKEKLLNMLDIINVILRVEMHNISLVVHKFGDNDDGYKNLKHAVINANLNYKLFFLPTENNLFLAFPKLDNNSIEKLTNSLRYFRLANNAASVEQKILNTWIALETIYIDSKHNAHSKNLIENILEHIPPLYNSFSIIRKIRYVKGILAKNKIIIPDEIKKKLNITENRFSERILDNYIWMIFKDNDLFMSLMKEPQTVQELEHLKYRCTAIFDFICNKDSSSGNKTQKILKNFDESSASVFNQLYRLYLMRNKIAHQGWYSNINPQLVNHLTDYLLISYAAITIGSTYLPKLNKIEKYSISDALSMYKLKYGNMLNNIKLNQMPNLDSVYVPINE